MRTLFVLPGLNAVPRGAEIAFTNIATQLSLRGHQVTLIGSGNPRPGEPYHYLQAPLISRSRFERFPRGPVFRNDTAWEEASFLPGFLRVYRPQDYDVTVACSYPFLNWALRARKHRGKRPAHVFVTQNGDWPAQANNSEYRWFGCDGLVCINPDYFEANKDRYTSALIPNGVDNAQFASGTSARAGFGLPEGVPIVLMVSALIESKQVAIGIEAVGKLPGVHLAVAGDGPLRETLRQQAEEQLPGRFHNFTVTADRMPDLYRSADLFMHLSRDESFGNVYVEAMASGLTTVAWDLPRTRWITGPTGHLVADRDGGALVEGIATALRQPDDVDALQHRAERFAWSSIAGEYDTFFEEVVGRRNRT